MTRDVVAVAEDTPVAEIAAILAARNIRRVPVVGGGSLVGIVSRADILRAMVALSRSRAAGPSADDRTLRDRILRMLSSETEVSTRSISVIVSGGGVYLWGVAETEGDKEAIRIAAERVAGADNVRDFVTALPRIVGAAF